MIRKCKFSVAENPKFKGRDRINSVQSSVMSNPFSARGRKRHVCVSVPKECVCVCNVYRTEGVYCRYIQYIRISVFVQSRRVHLFIVNCLLKNKFNIHVLYHLYKSTL